jgi:outer membrane protein assembly factor BamE (lipoprotein component of BamABCDE complex)
MIRIIPKALAAIIILTFISCSSPPDQIGGLDLKKWRSDRGGCNNVRAGLEKDFKAVQDQLKGKFADEIGKLLGRPDIHQLGERNLKYYVYFLEKGPQCEDMKSKSAAAKVILKFNAVGLLSEITYQDRPL